MTPQDKQTLISHLRQWDRRLRLTQSVRWAPRGLLAGLVVALIVALVARFRPLFTQMELIQVSLVLAGIGLLLVVLGVWATGYDLLQKARRFDLLFGLRERVSTALELYEGRIPVESEMVAAYQVMDAVESARSVRAADFLPFNTDWREWGGAGLLSLALVAAIAVPNPQEDILQQQAAVEEAIAEQIETLEELQERIETDDTLTAEEKAALSEVLESTIEELDQPGISQEEALAALDAAEQELRDLSEEFAEQQQEALEEASQALDGSAAEDAAEALEEGNALEAADQLQNLDLDSLSPEELEELAEGLQEAAEALAESNPELAEQLEAAADAIQNGDLEGAEQALEDAAGELAEGSSSEQVEGLADELDQAQSSVAGAGNQPGESGMGQAGQQGQGTQQGQQGQAGGGAGNGEGEAIGGGPEGDEMDTDNDPGDGGIAEYEGIYAPQRIGGEGGEDVDVPGDAGAGAPTGTEGDFADNPDGDSAVPYDQVFADYEGAVNEALESGYIPLSMREFIRAYFSRLNPVE